MYVRLQVKQILMQLEYQVSPVGVEFHEDRQTDTAKLMVTLYAILGTHLVK
jgi:hypothetical protein